MKNDIYLKVGVFSGNRITDITVPKSVNLLRSAFFVVLMRKKAV